MKFKKSLIVHIATQILLLTGLPLCSVGVFILMKSESKVIIYSDEDYATIRKYKLVKKAQAANERGKGDIICANDILVVLKKFNFKCIYCYENIKTSGWHLDHYFALSQGGKNHIDNIVPACKWCNIMKHSLDGFAFIYKCRKITENNILAKMGLPEYPDK